MCWLLVRNTNNGGKPNGPFKLLKGVEYESARKLANSTNAGLHRANPQYKGMHIHEIHPVKFGGIPTDVANKVVLTPAEHMLFTKFWNAMLKNIK